MAVINESAQDKMVRELKAYVATLEAKLADAVGNGADHTEVIDIHHDKVLHEQLLQKEMTHSDVHLAHTKMHLALAESKNEAHSAMHKDTGDEGVSRSSGSSDDMSMESNETLCTKVRNQNLNALERVMLWVASEDRIGHACVCVCM